MEVKDFLADLFCVFVPLLAFEVWHVRKAKSSYNAHWTHPAFILSLLFSAVVCTLFNFNLSKGVAVNLSIVPLTIAFFLLQWSTGLLVMVLYICVQIIVAIFELSHGLPTLHLIGEIFKILPGQLTIVGIYSAIMCFASILLRKHAFSARAIGFVLALFLYTLIDYAYVRHLHDFHHFVLTRFAAYILVFNLTLIIALRLLAAGQNSYQTKLNAIKTGKLQVISQLSASVAHEIRNPITVVRGYTQLMINQDYGRTKSLEFLQNMFQELERAELVISNYLHLSKKQADIVDMEVNVSRVIQEVSEALTPYAVSRNVELLSSIEHNIRVYGNDVELNYALTSVIKNAIEAIKSEGTVQIHAKQSYKIVELQIKDSGRGMSAEAMQKLGEPYYSTNTKGTGLSLTLVYKIITELKGNIHVQSREGVGTCFTITLPTYVPELNFRQIESPFVNQQI